MTIDSELSQKRLQLKNEINKGIDKTPMAGLFNSTGRLVQKITRHPRRFPFIFCVVVSAAITLLMLGLNHLLFIRTAQATTLITPISAAIVVETTLLIVAATYFNISRVLSGIRDVVVDFIISSEDLSKLQEWLSLGWSPSTVRRFLFWWVLITVGPTPLLFLFLSKAGVSAELLFPSFLFAVLGGLSFYYAPLMILLPIRLSTYRFKLYENDPARSEIMDNISTILNRFTYGYVFLNVVFQLSLAIANFPIIAEVAFMIVFGWVPVITQYFVNQTCIRSIVARSKRTTLNRIQVEVQSLQEGDVKNKENLEAINRLMDYHERIRATPDSNLNMQILGNFFNQLALPLLGFLLANINTIIDLFR